MDDQRTLPRSEPTGVYDFGEVAPDVSRWDCKHSDLLNMALVILSYEEGKAKFGKILVAHCVVDGEEKKVLIGGEVLINQLESIPADKFPVRAKIIKRGSYYEFTSAKSK
jgi:hypothetical protein